jgi:hypothetical protein
MRFGSDIIITLKKNSFVIWGAKCLIPIHSIRNDLCIKFRYAEENKVGGIILVGAYKSGSHIF